MAIRTKNIYDPASPEDGLRLLVMRKLTLLCGCRDEAHCHRTLLKWIIEGVDHSFSFGPGGEPPAGGK